ncbi:DUF3427 domain-containing protein [Clostridium sp. 'deep sea']|uniref:DUF3427 domain-containing protein n=1 Tax=Clostridium sp. 'deep sea' TaxID=2779445 RepID=UPI00189679BE|nr:DEAD/DEAH box helicase [Clostridium sp. 'deep sea']QOR36819.1 DUF3427 domain-containing protein [Clostridium sp. 'deep sea']
MKLIKGAYEQVINKDISALITSEKDIEVLKDKIDYTDSASILTTYFNLIMKKGLNYFKSSNDDLVTQINIVNNIISQLSILVDDKSFNKYQVADFELLKGIFAKEIFNKNQEIIFPVTSIANSTLFTGSYTEPTVFSELRKEIATADRVDLLVSFIKHSGLRLLIDCLKEHTKNKKLRVITTSYMGASDFKAIKILSELPNTEIKISYDTKRTRLHAKAYYFHRESGFSTAYIGSSNISKAALSEGTEWNLKISEYTSPEIINKYRVTFETYWYANDFVHFDGNNENDVRVLKKSLSKEQTENNINYSFIIKPYMYQQEILDKLEVERTVYKSFKNLIVAATGTGKTVVSAFDFKQYYKKNKSCRFLYLAHRKEILEQSLITFRTILNDNNFGDLWIGEHKPTQYNQLFASIQTLNYNNKFLLFEENYFDYIILDEAHHGAAFSYDKILLYFSPQILLGLTATPERTDNIDILKYFNDRISYEIRLHEAIDRNLLCPFHYFGITDSVSLDTVTWSRGRYETSELSNLYTGNDMRADLIVRQLDKYINDINEVKGIGFCVSQDHAKFMSYYFNKCNIPSINIDSSSSKEQRKSAKDKLKSGDLKFIFVVDIYNEGVDIPAINTVLFLRPTDSATIFIQQLGRGLRISEDKDVLTVLDFVGQANGNYDYNSKIRSIIGKTAHSIKNEVEKDFPTLPKGCYIQLERKAKDYILENLKNIYVDKNKLRRLIRNYKHQTNLPLTVLNFLEYYQLKSWQIYKTSSLYELGVLENIKQNVIQKDKNDLKSVFQRVLYINSKKFIDFILSYLKQKVYTLQTLNSDEKLMLTMFHYTVWNKSPDGKTVEYLYRLKNDNSEIFNEIIELLEYNKHTIDFIGKSISLEYNCPLELYAKYNIKQILTAFAVNTEYYQKPFREGVLYIKEKNTDLFFVTLNKSEKDFTKTTLYEDYAISSKLFHWQSQSRTSITSATGQRYVNQRKNENTVILFVRENKRENGITSPYYLLGKANYVSHAGSKPISITWELEHEIPTFILKKSNKLADVL